MVSQIFPGNIRLAEPGDAGAGFQRKADIKSNRDVS